MKYWLASYSKAQIKIQQMAFVLILIVIFFIIVGLIYLNVMQRNIIRGAEGIKEEETLQIIRNLAKMPEFNFERCEYCIDLDKVFVLKERGYNNLPLDLLVLEKVGENDIECVKQNYPNCNKITLIEKDEFSGIGAFVSLCRWEKEKGGYIRCDLGRIIASSKIIK